MSYDDQPDAIGVLTSTGLSGEEAQAVADLRAKGPIEPGNRPQAQEEGPWRLPAFWMAVGLLSFIVIRAVMALPFQILVFANVQSLGETAGYALVIAVRAATFLVCFGAAYILAQGKFSLLAERLACRYEDTQRLRNDLIVALFLFLTVFEAFSHLFSPSSKSAVAPFFSFDHLFSKCVSILPYVLLAYAIAKFFPATRGGQSACPIATNAVDVERLVEIWHDRMRGHEAMQDDDIAELEEHLREEMATLANSGLSEYEAFHIACRRIGPQDALEHEYAVVNAPEIWRNRAYWIAVGAFFFVSFGMLSNVVWFLLRPWVITSSAYFWIISSWSMAYYCLGFFLFLRFAQARRLPWVERLSRRHQSFAKLLVDLALWSITLTLVYICASPMSDNVLFSHDPIMARVWYLSVGFGNALLSSDTPILLLAAFGIAMLHPSRKPQGNKWIIKGQTTT